MKQVNMKLQSVLMGVLYGAMCSTPAFAEDIDIYTGSAGVATAATANILFVLDTSGSMSGLVVGDVPKYDHNVSHTGCFDPNRIYVGNRLLEHAKSICDGTHRYRLNQIDQFNVSALKCDAAATSLVASGSYLDRLAQLRTSTSRWSGTSTSWRSMYRIEDNYLTEPVECQADEGVHGEAAGDGLPYATDSASGWTSSSSSAVNWGRTGSGATLYYGNRLNQIVEGGGVATSTRLEIMQAALSEVINASEGVNIGLMRYSYSGEGGLVVAPMGNVSDPGVKDNFLLELSKMYHAGVTPLGESYYEAVMYMQGNNVDYGDGSSVVQYIDPVNSTALEAIYRDSHADSRLASDSSRYGSPISDTCQKNFVVLLTDGLPVSDDPSSKLSNIGVSGGCNVLGTGYCLEEIANGIGTDDQSTLSGKQVISTFTIGLDIASAAELLQGTANASKAASGVGEYYPASSATELTSAFTNIVTQVLDVDTTFSSPSVSVNAFNRATHLDDLYFSLFKPSDTSHWPGNLKKYKLKFYTDAVTNERVPFIADANDVAAIDDNTGFFKDSAVSYWTDTNALDSLGNAVGPDGQSVEEGGAASVMTVARNVYTTTGSYTANGGVYTPANGVLTASVNLLDKSNTSVTDALLETTGLTEIVTGVTYRETLLDWTNGIDVLDEDVDGDSTDVNPHMADPLHAEPALVQYGGGITNPDLVAYVATNDGYLHAFDADDGSEYFSFVPQELLPNLGMAMENISGGGKLYGLDGNVVAWVKDANGDGIISGADDHVYLYVSMRRGGNNIYALDVTSRTSPKLLWVIKGGLGDYALLGQTWSTINVEKVKDGTTEKTVLVFGGGYDIDQDSASLRTPDDVGNAVFIADATTGERLWVGAAGGDTDISEMQYSIPARIKPLDISGDGYIDRLYAADMGGQIFRFDIDNSNSALLANSISGGRIADLADGTAQGARRFYYPPDVALIDDPSGKYHSVVIASGFRANPIDEVIHDRIFMLKDRNTGLMSSGYTTLTETSLKDVTDNIAGGDGVDDAAREAELANISAKEGWYIDLDNESTGAWEGEKGLAEPLIVEGTAIITTYVPDFTTTVDSCTPAAGNGKVFFLDILDATPAYPLDIDKRPQRHIDLKRGGIPPPPNLIITTDKTPTLCVGTECQAADFGLGIRKTYWYEVEK